MKDIILKITGKTLSSIPKPKEGEEMEPVEFVTQGKLSQRGTTTFISYDETALSGMEGCKTSLTITPGKLKMKRSGDNLTSNTIMLFEKGKRSYGKYETPFGAIDMEVLTNSISPLETVDENKSKMSVEYAISLKGLMESTKTLDIEVVNRQ